MKKPQTIPWSFSVRWGNPYTAPPNGLPRVFFEVVRMQVGGHPVPAELDAAYTKARATHGPGWCVSIGVDPELRPRRTLRPEVKGSIRRKALARRINKKVPLFAEALIQRELDRNPDYYAGI